MRLRASVPGGSVFLVEGTPEDPANALTEPFVEVRRVAGPEAPEPSAVGVLSTPAGEGHGEMPPSAPLDIPPAVRRRRPRRGPHDPHTPRPAGGPRVIGPLATVGYYEPWWMQILKSLVIFFVLFNLVPITLLAERKLLGRFQHRYGPNRVGPFGILQPIADIGKLHLQGAVPPAHVGRLAVHASRR